MSSKKWQYVALVLLAAAVMAVIVYALSLPHAIDQTKLPD